MTRDSSMKRENAPGCQEQTGYGNLGKEKPRHCLSVGQDRGYEMQRFNQLIASAFT